MRKWLIVMIILIPSLGQADDSAALLLRDALLCKGSPLDVLRGVSAKNWGPTFAGTDFGEGLDHRNVVVLKTPIRIGGATTYAVVGELSPSSWDFSGIVYGRFRGDYKRVVEELGLVEQNKPTVGRFELAVEARTPDLLCPKTIGLTPKDDGEFLLGCGWCNG